MRHFITWLEESRCTSSSSLLTSTSTTMSLTSFKLRLRTQQGQNLQRSLRRTYSAEVQHNELAGTVASHSSYILLNTRIPPPSFPSRVSSKLQRTLQLHTNRWGGLVNLAWSPESPPSPVGTPEWESGNERYSILAFSARRGPLSIPEVSLQNVEGIAEKLREHASPPTSSTRPGSLIEKVKQQDEPIHIYVCTHGKRDCRCGETGGAVFDTFRQEVQRRSLQSLVKVGGVGHVGGHKYASPFSLISACGSH